MSNNIESIEVIKNKEYRCPLCNQIVSKVFYEKLTGIWKARQDAEKKFRAKLKELTEEKKRIKKQYKKNLKEEVRKKTDKLDLKILALKKRDKENKKMIKEKIKKMERTYRDKENKRAKQIEAKVTRKLKISHNREMKNISKRAKEMAKIKVAKEKEKLNQRIIKIEQSKSSLSNQLLSQGRHITDLENQNKELQDQLHKETTPQIEGLLYEDKLLKALKERYGDDNFKHTGKGGDIIQFVKCKDCQIGIIVYECKRTKHFYKDHIRQTSEAKLQRNADYAILVTSATKKNYKGFSIEKGVIIVHPAGVFSLVDLLRKQLTIISDLKLTKEQKEEAIQKTIEFIESPEFTNKLEAVIEETMQLHESLKKEINDHIKNWKGRHESYKKIYFQTSLIKEKTHDILSVKEPEKKIKKKYPILEISE